jgi:tRNA A37 threonylcarbamoyladenosine dehydratase
VANYGNERLSKGRVLIVGMNGQVGGWVANYENEGLCKGWVGKRVDG